MFKQAKITIPPSSVADQVSEQDRQWFLRHPGASERIPPPVPGELPFAIEPSGMLVRVVQLGPGIRMRTLVPESSVR